MTAHAAIHAAIANAIKATGVVVRLEPGEWLSILKRTENPLVVVAQPFDQAGRAGPVVSTQCQ